MDRPEFMQFKLSDIPNNIIDIYKLRDIVHNGYVFVRIQKGMYGLPQAGIIAQQLLEQCLQANGYQQSKINPGFLDARLAPYLFCTLCGQLWHQICRKEHADHLIQTLRGHYEISMDWNGWHYIGLTFNGTTITAASTSQCPATVKKLDSISTTPNLPNHHINHIPVLRAPMAKYNSSVPALTRCQHWTNNKRLSYKK
jgi:hypothetical protein